MRAVSGYADTTPEAALADAMSHASVLLKEHNELLVSLTGIECVEGSWHAVIRVSTKKGYDDLARKKDSFEKKKEEQFEPILSRSYFRALKEDTYTMEFPGPTDPILFDENAMPEGHHPELDFFKATHTANLHIRDIPEKDDDVPDLKQVWEKRRNGNKKLDFVA